MDTILMFFILPLATIILASVLEYLIRCPIAVTAIFFAVWLIVAYLIFSIDVFIIALVLYTILAFLSAVITRIILCNYHKFGLKCPVCNNNNTFNEDVEAIEDEENCNNNGNTNHCGCRSMNNNAYNIRRRYR